MSDIYSHILLATDLLDDNHVVIERAVELKKLYSSKLSVIHVVESVPIYFGNEMVLPEMQQIELQLVASATEKMKAMAAKYEIDSTMCYVEVGVTKLELINFAEKNKIDLIVIGSHSRHGLAHLLGSTARAVLNAAPCDVLSVKIS